MPEQLSLRYNPRFARAEAWDELLDAVREVVRDVGLKQAAYDLDVQPSALAHALAERDRHYLRLEWLPYLAGNDNRLKIIRCIAAWAGLEVKPRQQLTAEEWQTRVERALDAVPELAEIVRRKAGV
jgi:hypothetical protein